MTAPARPLRFGLVGTGHWARITHAPALASTQGIDFTGLHGDDDTVIAGQTVEFVLL